MSAEVLNRPTVSGEYEERRFDADGSCAWVLFHPPEEDEWVGVFGRGEFGRDAVDVHWKRKRAFVIAKGQGYLIDTEKRESIYRTEEDTLQDVAYVESRGFFVAADNLQLHVFGPTGYLWSTTRVSWDGIRNLCADGVVVSGEAWNLSDWRKFTLDVDSQRVTGATYNGPDATDAGPAT